MKVYRCVTATDRLCPSIIELIRSRSASTS
jgi:hypothetical protein